MVKSNYGDYQICVKTGKAHNSMPMFVQKNLKILKIRGRRVRERKNQIKNPRLRRGFLIF